MEKQILEALLEQNTLLQRQLLVQEEIRDLMDDLRAQFSKVTQGGRAMAVAVQG